MAIRFFHSFVGKTVHHEPQPIVFRGEVYGTEDEGEIAALENALDVEECDGMLDPDKSNEKNIEKEKLKQEKAAKREQEKLEREEEKRKEAEEKKAAEEAKAKEEEEKEEDKTKKEDKKAKADDTASVDSLGDGTGDEPAAF